MAEQGADHWDVLIVGAGLSGIGAAVHLQQACPGQRWALLEARDTLGGTWDLFRYPGVRSDSDMHTLGYRFKPWTDAQAIASGPAILRYLQDTVAEHGLAPHMHCGQRVRHARWRDDDGVWQVDVDATEDAPPRHWRCRFLILACGYYRYDQGHQPDFPGLAQFEGRLVHPQHWPADLAVRGQRVVVVGSGATAMTLVPALAQQGAQVTLLQRSPTYVVSRPSVDRVAQALQRHLPARLAHGLARWKNIVLGQYIYRLARRHPQRLRTLLLQGVRHALGPDFEVERHFSPRYAPWDQRLCLVPDGDLFKVLRRGQAQVLTDEIATFTAQGLQLRSGQALAADVVVSATGLELLAFGGIELEVNGQAIHPGQCLSYRGLMLAGVPNLVYVMGYTNASWTLRSDLVSQYACRLLRHMQKQQLSRCVAPIPTPWPATAGWADFSSGYILRSLDQFPRQGHGSPWCVRQSYLHELLTLRWGRLNDGVLRFS